MTSKFNKLKNEDFLNYFYRSETIRREWKIGLEQELFGFHTETKERIEYPEISKILKSFENNFHWQACYEDEKIIGAKKEGSKITIEPGGQLELSTPPCVTIQNIAEILSTYKEELKQVSKSLGITWLSLGYDPISELSKIPWMPKKRYAIMKEYLLPLGERAANMMISTCGVQTNFDYADELDMHKKMLVTTAFAPVAEILFANSPIRELKRSGQKSVRAWSWRGIDSSRTGIVASVFKQSFTYQDYIDYLIQVPMFLFQKGNKIVETKGKNFIDYLESDLHQGDMFDWEIQLGSTFPVARLKNAIETRSSDAGSMGMLLAQAAFWKGLLYHPKSLDASFEIIRGIGLVDWLELYNQVPEKGFTSKFDPINLQKLTTQILELSRNGLISIDETTHSSDQIYLKPLLRNFEQFYSSADLIEKQWPNLSKDEAFDFFEQRGFVFV